MDSAKTMKTIHIKAKTVNGMATVKSVKNITIQKIASRQAKDKFSLN